MEDEDHLDHESEAPEESGSNKTLKRRRRSVAKLRRELSEDELSTPGVQKLLIDEIERLETENSLLSEYRDKYYDSDKSVAILEERDKKKVAVQVMSDACLAVGAAALGLTPFLWSSGPLGLIMVVFGVILIVGSAFTKFVGR